MKIYSDPKRKEIVEQQLYENQEYYIDFQDSKPEEIILEIENSKLQFFLNWQSGNRYAKLKIINFIGNIYFFKNTYDIKSKKFLPDLSGVEQFQTLLSEIEEFSKNIIFSYNSPSVAIREVDYKDTEPTLLSTFNYFKEIILDKDDTKNLQSLINRVINNPNYKPLREYKIDKVEKIKKYDKKTINYLVNNQKYYSKVQKKELIDLPITKFISKRSSDNYFPTKALIKKMIFSYDTNENRFVKYFIEYIENTAFRLNFIKGLPENIGKEKDLVLSFCRRTLNTPFFKDIKAIQKIPIHSTVLQKRSGYKELLSHFLKSRFGIRYYFQKFQEESMKIALKPIADLYEYWAFFKILRSFLGNGVLFEEQHEMLKGEKLSYGLCLKNEKISVYYNLTESMAKKSAYSVTLRPDTTVIIQGKNGDIKKIAFDAKYKIQNIRDGAIERYMKSEDIHKMHTYVDAIKDCCAAIAIYPGTEFYFYEKMEDMPIKRKVQEVKRIRGVGAMPLTPDNIILNNQLDAFTKTIKDEFLL